MSKNTVVDLIHRDTITDALTEVLQNGIQQLIHQAVRIELARVLEQYADRLTAVGKAAVVRNRYSPERKILKGIGPVTIRIPKIRSKTAAPMTASANKCP